MEDEKRTGHHHDSINQIKSNGFENPVGPDEPLVKFQVPLWQVFTVLFLVAIVLTGFRMYETRYIAPHRKINWKPFENSFFQQEQRALRNILVWIESADPLENDRVINLLDSPEICVAAYRNRNLPLKIDLENRPDDNQMWIDRNAAGIAEGGFAVFRRGRPTRWLPLASVNPESLVALIEGL